MAVSRDIESLESNLVDCAGLDWVISGKPVVALFSAFGQDKYTDYDRSYLGRPSCHKKANDGLLLWIGISEDTDQLLVVLTQRIRLTSTNKYRLFFLCLPTEFLCLDVADPAVWHLADDTVPLNVVSDTFKTDSTKTSRLLRMSFALGKEKSWVIMPQFPQTGPVSLDAMSLLRKLKILSEVTTFDLFTSHDSWTQQALHKTQSFLKARDVSCPKIQYTKFYPAGRAAVVDRWDLQGWHDVQDDTEEDSDLTTRKASKRKCSDASPPSYDELPAYPSASQLAPASTDPQPRAEKHPRLLPAHTFNDTASASCEFQASHKSEHTLAVSLESTSPLLASEILHSSSHLIDICIPRTPDVDLSSAARRRHSVDTSTSFIRETPITTPPRPPLAVTNSIRRLPSEHISHVLCLQTIVPWLVEIWKRWPHAHYVRITQLLRLGVAMSKLDVDSYHITRAQILTSLLEHQTTQHLNAPTPNLSHITTRRSFFENGILELISWLLILHPDADIEFLDQLGELARLRADFVNIIDEQFEGTEKYFCMLEPFMRCKAQIVLAACVRFGEKVLRRDGLVAEKMSVEMVRIGF